MTTNNTNITSELVYASLRSRWAFLHDSYVGGVRWENPSSALGVQSLTSYSYDAKQPIALQYKLGPTGYSARSYLVPYPAESETSYNARRGLAHYENICAPIVDAYCDAITPGIRRELKGAERALKSVDGQGKEWPELVDEVSRWTATYGVIATVLDAPRVTAPQSQAQQSAVGTSLRVVVVHPPAFGWVKINDEDGALDEFAYVESPYVEVSAVERAVRVWVWTRADWYVMEGKVSSAKSVESQYDRLAIVADKTGKHGTPGVVPVAFAFYKRDTTVAFPLGYSLIDDTAKAGQLIYNELSRVEEYHRKGAAFLAIPTREQKGLLDPQAAIAVGPESAMGFASDAGAPQWVTPPAEMPAEIRAHCTFIMQSAFRAAGLEVEVDASAQVESGEALRVRSRGFEAKARRFAKSLRAWELRMLDLVKLWLGMPAEEISVTYPERYVLPDMAEDLARSVVFMDAFGDKVGPEGMTAIIGQALRAASTLSDAEATAIINEIHAKLTAPGTAGTSELFGYDIEAGLAMVNELRGRKGFDATEGGDVSTIVWKLIQEAKANKMIRDMGLTPPVDPVPGAA